MLKTTSRSLLALFLLCGLACTHSPKKITQVPIFENRSRAQYEATGDKWVIATQGKSSSQAGVAMITQGGNAFDAFAAVSFAMSVERPHSTGLGGGGFALFYVAREKKIYALDFRETAPRKAHSKMFLDRKGQPQKGLSETGALSVATPGLVAGVLEMHIKYGRLSRAQILAPAEKLAREGFEVYPALFRATQESKEELLRFPASKKIFLNPQGEAWPVGHLLIQTDLAETLALIAKKGPSEFYTGSIAKKIATTQKKYGGWVDKEDLKNYATRWREPVKGTYREYEVYSQPPPSSGGVHVIEILNIIEKDQLRKWGPQDPRSIHLVASAMQRAFVDRARFMGDPDFTYVPVDKLLSKTYAAQLRSKIPEEKALLADHASFKEESPDTVHFTLADEEGNLIASTQTINGYFGSGMVAEGTGIMLNNEMDDFAAQVGASNMFGAVGGRNNLVEPKKRPLSSMSPTIILKNGKAFMGLGSPSGTRIITCVAQTIVNALEFELPLWESVSLTRYHHQWKPDELAVESPMFEDATLDELKKMGFTIKNKDLGCRVQAVQKKDNQWVGVSDPREEGSALAH